MNGMDGMGKRGTLTLSSCFETHWHTFLRAAQRCFPRLGRESSQPTRILRPVNGRRKRREIAPLLLHPRNYDLIACRTAVCHLCVSPTSSEQQQSGRERTIKDESPPICMQWTATLNCISFSAISLVLGRPLAPALLPIS